MTEPRTTSLTLEALRGALAERLSAVEGRSVTIVSVCPIAADRAEGELKHVGYGEPLLVKYRAGADERRAVLRTAGANWFGHDRRSDRAALMLLSADTYDAVPDHIRVIDVGAVGAAGNMISLTEAGELYLLTTWVEGRLYASDLRRVERDGVSTPQDRARAAALGAWAAKLHTPPLDEPAEVYHRAIRDLVGSGEGIFGLVDSYPDDGPVSRERLARIEQRATAWRARLRPRHARLRQTHGDFHPYNVLFRDGVDFSTLDASRGCRGDPADDVAAMSVNYLLGAAIDPSVWQTGLGPLWSAFWESYFATRDDHDLLASVAPFFAWRLLVLASPVWYPSIPDQGRDALLSAAEYALDAPRVDLDAFAAVVRRARTLA